MAQVRIVTRKEIQQHNNNWTARFCVSEHCHFFLFPRLHSLILEALGCLTAPKFVFLVSALYPYSFVLPNLFLKRK